jgi:hypothetical protein
MISKKFTNADIVGLLGDNPALRAILAGLLHPRYS